MTRRRLGGGWVLLLALAAALGPASAQAFFVTAGAGSASAAVATINGPSGVSATQSGTGVTVSWTAATLSTGGAVQGYRVTRSDSTSVCGSPTLVTTTQCVDSGVAAGTYTYTVTAIYNSWDASATSASITVVAAPTLTSTPASTSARSSPSIAFSGGGSTYQCALDSGAYATCTSPDSLGALTDGSHTFKVRAVPSAGTGPATVYTWTINTSAPTITAKPAGTSATASPSFSFTHTASSYTFKCQLDSAAFASCTSPTAYSSLAAGSHTFTVEAFDTAGVMVASTASYTWTINLTAPTITGKPSTPSANTAPSFSFSDAPYTSFKCQLDSGGYTACTSPKALSGLASGSHTFTVEAFDAAGVMVPSPTSYTWTINTAAPAISSTPPSFSTSASASFSFSDATYSTLKCKLDTGAFAACTSPATYSSLTDAVHTFTIEAVDADGVATATASYQWTVDATPLTVTGITDTNGNGQLENGDTLIITFSKPLNPSTVPTTIAAGAASESRSLLADVFLTIPGITNGAVDTGSNGYLSLLVTTASATFGGTVSLVNGTSSATVTVTVSGLAGSATAASSGALAFTPATTIQDQLGGAATGTFTTASTFKLF